MESVVLKVEGGKPVEVTVEWYEIFHLTLVSLDGEPKEMQKALRMKVVPKDGEKTAIAYLQSHKWQSQKLNLVFDKTFQIQHNCEGVTVVCYGDKLEVRYRGGDDEVEEEEEEEEEEEDGRLDLTVLIEIE